MTRQNRIRLVSDGVVASYIHDISARTGPSATAPRQGRGGHRRAARPRPPLRRDHARPRELLAARR